MSSPLRFSDHTAFHLQVVRMSVAAAVMSLAIYLIGLLIPTNGRVAHALILALSATVLGLAAFPPPDKKGWFSVSLLGLGVGLLGALAFQWLAHSTPGYPWFGLGVYGLSIGVVAGRDLRGVRRFLLPLTTGALVVLATFVEMTFRSQLHLASYVPSFLAEPAYGVVYGFLVSVALVVRQLHWVQDPVTKAFEKVRPTLSGEMLELADQAVTLYIRTQQVLRDRQANGTPTEPALGRSVEKLVLRIFHMGRQWQEVERGAGRTNPEELTDRIATLEGKIEQTTDAVARKQYVMAREALNTQVRYLQDISRNRERVMARVHNYLATLERLQLALWNHKGTDAAQLSDEVQPILDEIDDIGQEMDFSSEAIDEVTDVAEATGAPAAEAAPEPEAKTEPEPEPETEPEPEPEPATVSATEEDTKPDTKPDTDAEAELAAKAFE